MASGAMGNILVDSSGMALYSPDQEADGTVHCVGGCLKIWIPLAPGANTPMAAPGGPTLGVIDRPDGTKQVTAGGRPLYTFFQDAAGEGHRRRGRRHVRWSELHLARRACRWHGGCRPGRIDPGSLDTRNDRRWRVRLLGRCRPVAGGDSGRRRPFRRQRMVGSDCVGSDMWQTRSSGRKG